MLLLWRRHVKKCPHDSRQSLKCACPIWIDWTTTNGKRIRQPLGLRDWQAAQRRAREIEAEGLAAAGSAKTIAEATEEFLDDAKSRNLREPTLRKYRWLFRMLTTYCQDRGLIFLSQLNEEEVRGFRNGWSLSPRTASKHLERLKSFLTFCQNTRYIKDNPAAKLKPPKVTASPVVPFTEVEIKNILAGCDTYTGNGKRLKTLTNLMLSTGLRISDACTISRDKIIRSKEGYSVELHTAKTGEKVCCPVQEDLAHEVEALPGLHPFWTGKSNAEDCAAGWRKAYARLFKQVGVKGHLHQFRHTFATRLLKRDVSMETVSVLLGHQSIKVTERHYASWTRERRQAIESAIRKTWVESAQA